jgi:hypothetical protein
MNIQGWKRKVEIEMSKGNLSRRLANGRKSPVARVINQVNRPQTHLDRTKYKRKPKYRISLYG